MYNVIPYMYMYIYVVKISDAVPTFHLKIHLLYIILTYIVLSTISSSSQLHLHVMSKHVHVVNTVTYV